MSELAKLLAKPIKNYTALEAAIVFTSGKHPFDAEAAALELAAVKKAAERLIEHKRHSGVFEGMSLATSDMIEALAAALAGKGEG